MKANDNTVLDRVILPIPESSPTEKKDMEIYARFMRHFRCVANSRIEIKILATIQFVADMLDLQDAEVAEALVGMGLRAPRLAFPTDYLDHADTALMRDDWEHGSAGTALKGLKDHWDKIGEDRFAAFNRHYPALSMDILTRA